MTPQRTFLLGAANSKESDRLCEALLRIGARCDRVSAGPQVVERALFERYDAVVLDASIGFLDPRHVRDLLRTNPRTRSLPVYLVDVSGARAGDSEYVQQPAKNLHWLKELPPHADQTTAAGSVSANLSEIQLPDMLQMLLANQRSGVIEIHSRDRVGVIEIASGGFGSIRLGEHKNLKALARILTWREGTFCFQPRDNIVVQQPGSAINLLLDAVRLSDETEHLRQALPAGSRLFYVAKPEVAKPSEPLLDEVLLLVDFYGAVDDILERLAAPDAEILAAIIQLRDQGWVDVRAPLALDGGGVDWPDLPMRPEWQGRLPSLWLLGADANFARVLCADARLSRRLNHRRSLKNPGRFGGNGWIIDAGKGSDFWLRFFAPSPLFATFAWRPDVFNAGAIAVVSELDLPDWDLFFSCLQTVEKTGQRTAWLTLDQGAYAYTRQKITAASLFGPADDFIGQCWRAIAHVLGN